MMFLMRSLKLTLFFLNNLAQAINAQATTCKSLFYGRPLKYGSVLSSLYYFLKIVRIFICSIGESGIQALVFLFLCFLI